jgi:hypothetical protein
MKLIKELEEWLEKEEILIAEIAGRMIVPSKGYLDGANDVINAFRIKLHSIKTKHPERKCKNCECWGDTGDCFFTQ